MNTCNVLETYSVNPSPQVPEQLNLQVSTSTTQCTVHWNQNNQTDCFNCQVKVSVYNANIQIHADQPWVYKTGCIWIVTVPFSSLNYTWHSVPGQDYDVDIEVQNQYNQAIVARESCHVRACYSKHELQQLHSKAQQFIGTNLPMQVNEVYRCKPYGYWQNIFHSGGVMRPYLKDENGHAANHINSTLKGLFFSAELNWNGTKRDASYFGDRKYSVYPHELLNSNFVNFYFCDFYCNAHNPTKHFVTIVVCKKQSPSDIFCNDRLILLPTSNYFFHIMLHCSVYFVNHKVSVEFFYTEDVPLQQEKLTFIRPLGLGSSRPGGLPNNKNCRICNFF